MSPADLVACFLEDAGYDTVSEWAFDSDYRRYQGEWWDETGHRVDIEECLIAAIEACGYDPVNGP